MGLSSSKSKQTNDPSAFAKPYIAAGANALGSAYAATQPTLNAVTGTLGANLSGLADKAFGANPGIDAATDYNTDVLNGDYLRAGNPYLQSQIDQTNAGVRSNVATAFTNAGRTGSGANTAALARGLAANESNLRYTDYSNERTRMGQAASLAPTLNSAQYTGLGAYLQAAQAALGLPLDAANSYAGGLGSLVGRYGTQTGTQTPSGLQQIGQALNIGKSIAGFF